ncbi:proline dehydrogenase family protein [Pinibacter aurantiacus]|uniref:Proline dehydrogenase family protein n=1 Tax=Pinibacter aurantiacus TaxID=2851599 RepID=A0A9E2SCF0_9BACT|nr:proline dehydrogenase family protein [Pinibacter aurantiacus]MBV4358544.1 proline dehydrogenase family protein [Pinibacter aurantiacus]
MNTLPKISFDNTANAFEYKSDKLLKKARFLFSCMKNNFLVKAGMALTPLAIKLRLPVKGLIRSTIFQQFVGGETLEQTKSVAETLGKYHVQVILDYGVEGGNDGEQGFDHSTEEFLRVINYAATQKNIPFMSIKVTGLARFELLENINALMNKQRGDLLQCYDKALQQLSAEEKAEWQRVVDRVEKISKAGYEKNVGVLVDAEETWIQEPVDALTTKMMEKFNHKSIVIYNTLQMYRHDRLQFLEEALQMAIERKYVLGAKIVRGAYMEKERDRAEEMGYPSPIQPNKEATDRDYNAAVDLCVDNINNVALIVASHNEYSNLFVTEELLLKGFPLDHPHVHFSQLYGMSDNITFNLAKAGCSVSKYLPFGPIKDVVPYLMRRAEENSSLSGQTGRELSLIEKEIKRRAN